MVKSNIIKNALENEQVNILRTNYYIRTGGEYLEPVLIPTS